MRKPEDNSSYIFDDDLYYSYKRGKKGKQLKDNRQPSTKVMQDRLVELLQDFGYQQAVFDFWFTKDLTYNSGFSWIASFRCLGEDFKYCSVLVSGTQPLNIARNHTTFRVSPREGVKDSLLYTGSL